MARKTECYADTAAFIAFLDKSDSHHTLFRRLRAHESAHKSFYWSVAADTWQRLHPWQRRLTRVVVTKTYAPVGAGGSSDRPALARTAHPASVGRRPVGSARLA